MFILKELFSISTLLLAVRVGGAGIGFGMQLLLARLLEPAELGLFYSITSTAVIASLVLGLGYPSLMTRFIYRYEEQGKLGRVAAFLRQAQRETILWSIGGAILLAVFGWLAPGLEDGTRLAIVIGAATILPMSLHRIHSKIAFTYRMFIASYVPSFGIRPLLFAIPLAILLLVQTRASVPLLMALQFLSYIVVTAITFYLVRHIYLGPVAPRYDARLSRRWRRESWPLIITAAFVGLLTDLAVVFVSPFMSLAEVAAFGLCVKIAYLVGYTVQIAHEVMLPDLGQAIARREGSKMTGRIIGSSLMPLALTVVGIIGSMLFGDEILGLFGDEFRSAQNALTILMVAQLVRALAGPGPMLLSMKGAQTASAVISCLSMGVLIAGNAVLGPIWGAAGGALSLLLTTIFWLGATAIMLYRTGGLRADLASLLARPPDSIEPAE